MCIDITSYKYKENSNLEQYIYSFSEVWLREIYLALYWLQGIQSVGFFAKISCVVVVFTFLIFFCLKIGSVKYVVNTLLCAVDVAVV